MSDKIRVLAIDDAIANLAIIKGCLRNGNFDLVTQTNALEALHLFKESFFDVVLLDVLMPGISGFELRKLIREIDKERPIIFLTSMVDDGSMTMLNQIAWDPHTFYLQKLTSKDILIQKINDVVKAHRTRQMDKLRSRKLEEELQLAGNLQRLLLPQWSIADGKIIAGSVYSPALLTSGDIFEILELSENRYLFFVGDIAGHGIAAALYMTTIQTYLKMLTSIRDLTVNELLSQLNKFVCAKIGNNAYLTAMAVIFDFNKNHLTMHNAGHLPLLRCTPSGVVELECKSDGLPLGWFEDSDYSAADNLEYDFEDTDLFMAMTDGLFDMEDDQGNTFEPADLNELLGAMISDSDAIILPNRVLSIFSQLGYNKQTDDVTIVTIQKRLQQPLFMEKVIPPKLPLVDKTAEEYATVTNDLRQQAQIELCLHEFLNNVIIHGSKFARANDSPIYVSIKGSGSKFEVRVVNCGSAGDFSVNAPPQRATPPTEDEAMATSGRGIQILQSITENIRYNSYAGVNEALFSLKETTSED